MKSVKLANQFVLTLLILCGGPGVSFGDEIDDLIKEYKDYDLKPPSRSMFTTSHASRYFSNSEIGNTRNCYRYFLANEAFWFYMDELRGAVGLPMIISSGYRNPVYNDNLPKSEDRSVHQFGGAADVGKVNGIKWKDMTTAQKDAVLEQIQVAEIILQSVYGDDYYIYHNSKKDHLHLQLMDYCGFDENY